MKDFAPEHYEYLTTFTGRKFRLRPSRAEDVDLWDIAHSLAMQCRFNGHVSRFYSVAEHSILVCQMAEEVFGRGSLIAKCALLHDAAEAYISDLPSPIKRGIPQFKFAEQEIEAAVHEAFDLPDHSLTDVWDRVKHYDLLAAAVEATVLFPTPPDWAEVPLHQKYQLRRVQCYSPAEAKEAFLEKAELYVRKHSGVRS